MTSVVCATVCFWCVCSKQALCHTLQIGNQDLERGLHISCNETQGRCPIQCICNKSSLTLFLRNYS